MKNAMFLLALLATLNSCNNPIPANSIDGSSSATDISARTALSPSLLLNKHMKVYTISPANNTIAYADSVLSSNTGMIYSSDELHIYYINETYAYLSYPTSSGRKNAYIPTDAITPNNICQESKIATSKITTYRRSVTNEIFGNISAGDEITAVGTAATFVQVIYPVNTGYKMGWVTQHDYKNRSNSKVISQTSAYLPPVAKKGAHFGTNLQDRNWHGPHDVIGVTKDDHVIAITDGTVSYCQAYTLNGGFRYLTSYGNFIRFTSRDLKTKALYAHLNNFKGVPLSIKNTMTMQISGSSGTLVLITLTVQKGDTIGFIGTTGNSNGVHLHFELRIDGNRVDPTKHVGLS